MLVGMDPTYWCVILFVGLFFAVLPPRVLILRTSAVLRMIGDPNLDMSLVRIRLRNRWEVTDVVRAL